MILSIDVDGVLRNQRAKIIQLAWQQFGVMLKYEDFDRWDPPLGWMLGMSEKGFITFAWKNPVVKMFSPPQPGARETLTELRRQGFYLLANTATALPQLTRPWFDFWQIPYDEIVHTTDKAKVLIERQAVAHLEDGPHIIEELMGKGLPVIRFELLWNEHLNGVSVGGWDEVMATLKNLEAG